MFELDTCPSCNKHLPDDELTVAWIIQGSYGFARPQDTRVDDVMDLWICPSCHFDLVTTWRKSETSWFGLSYDDGLKPDLEYMVCCGTVVEKGKQCGCTFSLSFTEADLTRFTTNIGVESFYLIQADGLDCRTCKWYASERCQNYGDSLFTLVVAAQMATPISLCNEFDFNEKNAETYPNGMFTKDLMAMKLKDLLQNKKGK